MRRADFELWTVTIFGLFYIVSSMFLKSTIPMHTFYSLGMILIIMLILDRYLPYKKGYSFLKIVNVFFWTGQALLYVVNAFKYWGQSVDVWFENFNNYMVLIPVYVISILVSIIYMYGRSKHRKI